VAAVAPCLAIVIAELARHTLLCAAAAKRWQACGAPCLQELSCLRSYRCGAIEQAYEAEAYRTPPMSPISESGSGAVKVFGPGLTCTTCRLMSRGTGELVRYCPCAFPSKRRYALYTVQQPFRRPFPRQKYIREFELPDTARRRHE
jgi:hypothetical protein